MAWILGRAKTTFHHAPNTISLTTKSNSQTSLLDVCKSVAPPCNLNPFLFNGHLQTIWTAYKNQDVPITYKRKIFESVEPSFPGSYAVDFVVHSESEVDSTLPPRTTYFTTDEWDRVGSDDSKPMLVTLHGLTGGSHELYLRHVLAPLVAKGSGWEACVINGRGCAMSKITSQVIFNARTTWDLRQTVTWLRKTFPNRPLFGVGFSLGANILANYLGEEGEMCEINAAVLCSNPWNLDVSNTILQSTWIGLNVYSNAMGTNIKRLFEENVDQLSKNSHVDVDKVRRHVKYLHEFDREVQAPAFGYPTEGAYYRDASSVDALLAVKIPVLAISAEDDPIAMKEAVPYQEVQQTPYVCLCETTMGGHLGWFQWDGDRWFAKPAVGFLRKMAEDVDWSIPVKPPKPRMPMTNDETRAYHPLRRKMVYATIAGGRIGPVAGEREGSRE